MSGANGFEFKFQKEYPLDKRIAEATRLRIKYPDRIPVIVEKGAKTDLPDLGKTKFLVPKDISITQFMQILRKRIKLTAGKALIIFINNELPPGHELMSQIDLRYNKDKEFLYVLVLGENAFG